MSAVPNSIIPVKCSFCRKGYARGGTYETHLRSAHANREIVLASTILNPPADVLNDQGTDLSDANEPIEHSDAEYESDPAGDRTCSERDTPDDTLRRAPEPDGLEDNTYSVPAEQEDYPGAGKLSERLNSTRKNAGICARTHGLCLLLHKASNLHLVSLRAKSPRCGLMITF